MARPVGEELARNPTAISRPKGGWFAKIWKQRSGSDPGSPSVDKIHLERANPFTLWVDALKQPDPESSGDSGQVVMPSKAFTLWTAAAIPENPFGEDSAEDSPGDQIIAPLPEGVFEETDEDIEPSGEVQEQHADAMHSHGHSLRVTPAHPFTIWTTPEALASLPCISAGQLYSQGTLPEVEDEKDASVDEEVGQPEPLLIHIGQSSAFTRWTDDRYNSPANLQVLSPVVTDDSASGQQALDEPAPALADAGNSSPGGGVARLVALAALILLLISAMFVIAAKDKEISDLMGDAREEKKKMNGLKHDKKGLKGMLHEANETSGGLAKKLAGLESDFTAAKENHAKESTALQARFNQLEANRAADSDNYKRNQIIARVEQEGLKKALNIAQSESDQARNDAKKAQAELEQEMQRRVPIEKELNEARKAAARLGEKMDLDAQKMAQAGKALEEARAQMTAGKSQLEQSEKKAAQLAAEVKKLKAQVDDLKSNPADPPAPAKPPEPKPKPGPAPDPVPEAEPKEAPKEKPDKGPINV